MQFAEHVHSEAARVLGESQTQAIQSQRELDRARGETHQTMQMASQEIELVRHNSYASKRSTMHNPTSRTCRVG